MLVMTAARDELHRLIEQLPEDQVSAALIEVQRLTSSTDTSRWPLAWFGAHRRTTGRRASGLISAPQRSSAWPGTAKSAANPPTSAIKL